MVTRYSAGSALSRVDWRFELRRVDSAWHYCRATKCFYERPLSGFSSRLIKDRQGRAAVRQLPTPLRSFEVRVRNAESGRSPPYRRRQRRAPNRPEGRRCQRSISGRYPNASMANMVKPIHRPQMTTTVQNVSDRPPARRASASPY